MCIRDSDNPIPKPLTDLTSNTYFNISFFTNTKSIILFTSIPSLPTPTLVYLWILLCLKKVLLTHIPLSSQKSITFLPFPFSPATPKPTCYTIPFLITYPTIQVPQHNQSEAPTHPIQSIIQIIPKNRTLQRFPQMDHTSVSYTHLRAHETPEHLVCRLLL